MPASPPFKYQPEELQKKINQYFQWVNENPFYKYDVVKTGQDAGKELKIKVERMPSVQSLCSHLNITYQTFFNYLKPETEQKNKQIFDIAIRAKVKIESAQIDGAGTGLYQPMIVSRLNHLKDEQEVTQTTIEATGKSEEEIKAAIQAIQAARKK